MELLVLVDNNTLIDRYFHGEPGVSYLIRENNKTILFDVGYSDIFIRNAQRMNLSLLEVDFIVISHGHIDHTGGLEPLAKLYTEASGEKIPHRKPTLVAHPWAFFSKKTKEGDDSGALLTREKLALHFELNLSRAPLWLSDKLVFLGEIERNNDFEAQAPRGQQVIDNITRDDYLLDDSAMAYKTPEGLVIITGCSHSGICNITAYAKKVCRDDRIVDIIGGFHLQRPGQVQMQKTAEYLKQLKLKTLHACHCTDLQSKIALSRELPLQEVGVGLRLTY